MQSEADCNTVAPSGHAPSGEPQSPAEPHDVSSGTHAGAQIDPDATDGDGVCTLKSELVELSEDGHDDAASMASASTFDVGSMASPLLGTASDAVPNSDDESRN